MATGGLRLLLCVQLSHALGRGCSEALKFRRRLASGLFCAPPGRLALWFPPGDCSPGPPCRADPAPWTEAARGGCWKVLARCVPVI